MHRAAAGQAHVWPLPAVMAVTPARPVTVTGTVESVVVPFPS